MSGRVKNEVFVKGWDLAYFQSGEWQVVKERLDDYDKMADSTGKPQYCPSRGNLFAALDAVSFDQVRVAIMGQDPYPNPAFATGLAFSIPVGVTKFPPTLVNLLREYSEDLHYPTPKNGDLTPWVKQGVLLWNAYPTCSVGHPGSHHWNEWTYLTKEIMEKLDALGTVIFVFLGKAAHEYSAYVSRSSASVIRTSHPSPLGVRHGFQGSRIFSTVNQRICELELQPIDWRL